MLYPIGKQAYKLELSKNWKIHDFFHVLLLEQDIIRKGWINKFLVPEFEPGNDKKYKVEAIQDSAVYAKETNGYLPGLYYLVSWKDYPKEENTWKPFSAVMHLRKIVSTFQRDHLEKPTVTLVSLDSALPMAKPIIQLPTKRKQGQPIRRAKKHAK